MTGVRPCADADRMCGFTGMTSLPLPLPPAPDRRLLMAKRLTVSTIASPGRIGDGRNSSSSSSSSNSPSDISGFGLLWMTSGAKFSLETEFSWRKGDPEGGLDGPSRVNSSDPARLARSCSKDDREIFSDSGGGGGITSDSFFNSGGDEVDN